MGRRGPPAKPPELKLIEGNPGHQRINQDRPKPAPLIPSCPRWLGAAAKREWRRASKELEKLGLISRIDLAAFAAYCQALADFEHCQRVLDTPDEDGVVRLTITTKSGYSQPKPEVAIKKQAWATIKSFCTEFGMTPSARGTMSLPKRDESGDDSFLRGPAASAR